MYGGEPWKQKESTAILRLKLIWLAVLRLNRSGKIGIASSVQELFALLIFFIFFFDVFLTLVYLIFIPINDFMEKKKKKTFIGRAWIYLYIYMEGKVGENI